MEQLMSDIEQETFVELLEILEMVPVDEVDEQLYGVVHRALSRVEQPVDVCPSAWAQLHGLFEHTIGTTLLFVEFDEENVEHIAHSVIQVCRRRIKSSGLYEELIHVDEDKVLESLETMCLD